MFFCCFVSELAKQQQHAQAQPPPQQQPAMSAEPERKQTRKRSPKAHFSTCF